ncbi:hypothetical protein MUA48_08020 [Staphylococcus sp. IVB6238]|uniref:hypothetical protein n=1 Tax=Staphylococcus sp. IVB6238 TaxID=2989770 RepID=UPI0021CFDAA8|nr:hypothetical protein [Staphylococcus sp. IVB6238]UXR73318.1 hypothetical protein MUA48_08020 [Staphylococcus sp. IVB6238]
MSPEINLYNKDGNVVGSYITLSSGKVRVFGLLKSFNFDEYILSESDFKRVQEKFDISPENQTSIFDFI